VDDDVPSWVSGVLATLKKGTNQQQPKANEWRRVIKSRGGRGGRGRERERGGADGGWGMVGWMGTVISGIGWGQEDLGRTRRGGKAETRAEEDD